MKNEKDELDEPMDMEYLVAFVLADIDVFLFQNEDQTADNSKDVYTRDEVRTQMQKTGVKIVQTMERMGFNVNAPLPVNHAQSMLYQLTLGGKNKIMN